MEELTTEITPPPVEITQNPDVFCCILRDNVPATECIRCPGNHYIHESMVEPFVDMNCNKHFDDIKANQGRVRCPDPNCEEFISEEELAAKCDPNVFMKAVNMRVRYEEHLANQEKLEQDVEMSETEKMHQSIREQFQKSDGTFSGFRCPRCKFGPIDKKACDDLTAHHHQRVGAYITISNTCPLCYFFSSSVSSWERWDGTFISEEEVANVRARYAEVESNYLELNGQQVELAKSLATEKRELAQGALFDMHFMVMNSIGLNHYEEEVEEEEQEEEEVEGAESQEFPDDTPEIVRGLMITATGEEYQALSVRLMNALKHRRTRGVNAVAMQRYTEISRDLKQMGDNLRSAKFQFENNVNKAMVGYGA